MPVLKIHLKFEINKGLVDSDGELTSVITPIGESVALDMIRKPRFREWDPMGWSDGMRLVADLNARYESLLASGPNCALSQQAEPVPHASKELSPSEAGGRFAINLRGLRAAANEVMVGLIEDAGRAVEATCREGEPRARVLKTMRDIGDENAFWVAREVWIEMARVLGLAGEEWGN